MLMNVGGKVYVGNEPEDAIADIKGVAGVLSRLACGDANGTYQHDEQMYLMLSRVLDDALAVIAMADGDAHLADLQNR